MKKSSILGEEKDRVLQFTITKEHEEAADIEKYPVKFKTTKRDFFGLNSIVGLEIKYHNVVDFYDDSEEDNLIIVFHDNSFCLIGCAYGTRLIDVLSASTLEKLGFVTKLQAKKIEAWHDARTLQVLKNRAYHIAIGIKELEAKL